MRWQALRTFQMGAKRILSDGERDARAAELGRVHVAVDPYRRAGAVGVAPDRQQPELAPLGAAADRFDAHELRKGARPGLHLGGELLVVEVARTKPPMQVRKHGA